MIFAKYSLNSLFSLISACIDLKILAYFEKFEWNIAITVLAIIALNKTEIINQNPNLVFL